MKKKFYKIGKRRRKIRRTNIERLVRHGLKKLTQKGRERERERERERKHFTKPERERKKKDVFEI